jgi:hypothetical protein
MFEFSTQVPTFPQDSIKMQNLIDLIKKVPSLRTLSTLLINWYDNNKNETSINNITASLHSSDLPKYSDPE